MWLFDLFISSSLQIWYVKVRIPRSISESPLDFELTRADCTLKIQIFSGIITVIVKFEQI